MIWANLQYLLKSQSTGLILIESPPTTSPAVLRAPREAAADVRLLAAVVVAGFCTFLQVYATQPLLPLFRRLFGATELQVSLTVSAVTAGVALASPLVGLMADAIGRKRIIVPAILGLAIPTILSATAQTLPQLIFWRFLQGLFVPGIIAVMLAYIAEEAPQGTAGSVTAAYVTGTVLGGLCGRLLTAILAQHSSWQTAFATLGVITLLGGLLTWTCLPRSRRFRRGNDPLAVLRAMAGHLRNRRLLATYFVGFNVLFTLVGIFTYANFYLAAPPFGLSTAALGSVFLVYALGVVVTPASGPVIDRWGHRSAILLASAIVVAGGMMTLVHALPMVIAGMAVLSTGVFIAQSAASSHIGAAAQGARSAAAGLYVAFYYLGGSAGAAILGVVWKAGHWPACIAAVIVLQVLICATAWRFFQPEETSLQPADLLLGENASA